MALLEVRGLVKYYGRRKVVDGVSFDVSAGEVVGLLGPNGAGKTTSFRMATGQITPNAGAVLFNGEDVTKLPMYQRARLGMGYLSQETSVFRKLTVEQNLLAILEIMPQSRTLGRPLTSKERHERMNTALEQFGLQKVRKNVAARLSGGEKRRLEIARCLVCEPLLILLDEPFTGIDPITIAEIRQIVRDLKNQGIGVLLDRSQRPRGAEDHHAQLPDQGRQGAHARDAVADHPRSDRHQRVPGQRLQRRHLRRHGRQTPRAALLLRRRRRAGAGAGRKALARRRRRSSSRAQASRVEARRAGAARPGRRCCAWSRA